MVQAYKEVGIVSNRHRQVHLNSSHGVKGAVMKWLIVFEDVAKLGVLLQELLDCAPYGAVHSLLQGSIGVQRRLSQCFHVESNVVKYTSLDQGLEVEDPITDGDTDSRIFSVGTENTVG